MMNLSKTLRVTQQRNFSAHHMLIGAARAALDDAESDKPGWFYSELTAITLAALSVEAICNSVGVAVVDDWEDFESMAPYAKLRYLCGVLGVKFDKDKKPWTTAKWLCKFRNRIAHAKPERIDTDRIMTRKQYDAYECKRDAPKSKLESDITRGNAKAAVQTAQQIKEALCTMVPVEKAGGLYSDSWMGNAHAPNPGEDL
jgi:hypothetical protein